jgi:hypothetical protein
MKHPQSYVHTLIADFKRVSVEMTNRNSSDGSTESDRGSAMDVEEGGADVESMARKEWSSAAEKILHVLQLSKAALLFSPLVIAVAALKSTEPMGVFNITFDAFLQRRFGNAADSLIIHYSAIEVIVDAARTPIDLVFLKTVCMERLKKDSVWSKAKVKKPKSSQPQP